MSDNAKQAFDKGFADGAKRADAERKDSTGTILNDLNPFAPSDYKGNKDFPDSYKAGYGQGKKNG
jgi:hypothetical protein